MVTELGSLNGLSLTAGRPLRFLCATRRETRYGVTAHRVARIASKT
jgi:hypothetical protein